MGNPKKCANMACNCLAPEKKKYCSDHCEGIGSKMEILCLCGHAVCEGVPDSDSQADKNAPRG
jgi:hypothetical protein